MRIGLTGGIGSGKSAAARMLATLGAAIVDADAIAHRLTAADGAAMPAMRDAFGQAVLTPDGALDRAAMREIAFGDASARRRLEGLLHPLIAAAAQAEAAASASAVIVFDIPLLAESRRWRQRVERVLVIDCSEATQIERILQRPGWTRDTAASVISKQAPRALRRAAADAVVFNDGADPDALRRALAALWKHWQLPLQNAVEQ